MKNGKDKKTVSNTRWFTVASVVIVVAFITIWSFSVGVLFDYVGLYRGGVCVILSMGGARNLVRCVILLLLLAFAAGLVVTGLIVSIICDEEEDEEDEEDEGEEDGTEGIIVHVHLDGDVQIPTDSDDVEMKEE